MRVAIGAMVMSFGVAVASPACANWFSTLLREGGEAGVRTATHLPYAVRQAPIGKAAAHLSDPRVGAGSLAAHLTPEGHWQFANRDGQLFTAASVEEMRRVQTSLLPGGDQLRPLDLYLSEDSAFAPREFLAGLPETARLHIVSNRAAFPLSSADDGGNLVAAITPNLKTRLDDRALFAETTALLSRHFKNSSVRTLSVAPTAQKVPQRVPRIDQATQLPDADLVAPDHLPQALRALRGQTVILTGRIDGGSISFGAAGGRPISELAEIARANDVSLILINTKSGAQPGGRTWLWRTTSVDGLAAASGKSTFGDFLDALGAANGGMTVTASRDGADRIRVSATTEASGGIVDDASSTLGDALAQATGEFVQKGGELFLRDDAAQAERDQRLIPFLPSAAQFTYIGLLVCGLLGFPTARAWWRRVAPDPDAGRTRTVFREAAFALVFLPLAGPAALVWQALAQVAATIAAPFRWAARKLRRTPV